MYFVKFDYIEHICKLYSNYFLSNFDILQNHIHNFFYGQDFDKIK